MDFKPGKYKTMFGLTAVVAQLRCYGTNDWILRGAISLGGVLVIHHWNLRGKSVYGETKYDLVRAS